MNAIDRKKVSLSVVIPAYNEQDNIKRTIEEITGVINDIPCINEYLILVIDDHSSDVTYDIINNLKNLKVGCLRLSKRSGSYTALRAGIAEAKGNIVLCISADGQDDPSVLKHMVDKWQKGADVVWALRKSRDNERFDVRILSKLFYKILNWLVRENDNSIKLSHADFCLLDRRVADKINLCTEKNTSLFGLIVWLGFNQDFVEYKRRLRFSGNTKWSLKSRFRFAKDWVIAFSGLPLKLMTFIGFITALIGFLYTIVIIIISFRGYPVQGWASTMIAILIIGGLQMIMLGIIGEYLWRTLDETRKRPLYFIEKKTYDNTK